MRTWSFWAVLIVLTAVVVTAGCSVPSSLQTSTATPSTGMPNEMPGSPAVSGGSFGLHVDSLEDGAVIPDIYTCNGAGESPKISWDGIPAGSKSLVLILEDPDAPSGFFTHWIVFNLPPTAGNITGGLQSDAILGISAQQALNTAGSQGYYPPCPPVGTTHRYMFRLYALDTEIAQSSLTRESIDSAMKGHILGSAEFDTIFSR